MSTPVGASLYTQGFGSRPENVEIPFYSSVAPASTNVNFPLGKRWITPNSEYVLTSFTSSNGSLSANWSIVGVTGYGIALSGITPSLSSGSVTISNSLITSSSVVIYSAQAVSPTSGTWSVTVSNGSFQITSNAAGDTTNFYYIVINP